MMDHPAEQAPDLLTVQEVAGHLRVDCTTVRSWIRQGALEGITLPSSSQQRPRYRVRREVIEQILGHDQQQRDRQRNNEAERPTTGE